MKPKKNISLPEISIIIICDQLRKEKLQRLFQSLQPQLSSHNTEILLLQESNTSLEKSRLDLPSFRYAITQFAISSFLILSS